MLTDSLSMSPSLTAACRADTGDGETKPAPRQQAKLQQFLLLLLQQRAANHVTERLDSGTELYLAMHLKTETNETTEEVEATTTGPT